MAFLKIKNALLALREIGEIERFHNTKSLPENLQSAKSKKCRKGGNCCNSSSHGRVGLLGTNKEGILQRMKEGNKNLVFFIQTGVSTRPDIYIKRNIINI